MVRSVCLTKEQRRCRKVDVMQLPYERAEPLYYVKKLIVTNKNEIVWETWGRVKNVRQLSDMLYQDRKKLSFEPISLEILSEVEKYRSAREEKKKLYLESLTQNN